jgi:hypothetical protein
MTDSASSAVVDIFDGATLKTCRSCKMEKPASAFSVKEKNRLQTACKTCRAAARRARSYEEREASRKWGRLHYAEIVSSEGGRESLRAAERINYEKNTLSVKYRRAKSRFGLSRDQIDALVTAQHGMCANRGCGTAIHFGDRLTHIDHDHARGNVRGLLCFGCNVALGNLKESKNRILGLIEYLESYEK